MPHLAETNHQMRILRECNNFTPQLNPTPTNPTPTNPHDAITPPIPHQAPPPSSTHTNHPENFVGCNTFPGDRGRSPKCYCCQCSQPWCPGDMGSAGSYPGDNSCQWGIDLRRGSGGLCFRCSSTQFADVRVKG